MSRRMRWAEHVARMGEKKTAYRLLVGKPEGKRRLGRPRRRLVDNIRTNLLEIGWGDNWNGLTHPLSKAAIYTGQHNNRIIADIHSSSGIGNYGASDGTREKYALDGHCNQQSYG
jgi:hypothetical protein